MPSNPNPMYLEKPWSLAHHRSMSDGTDPVKIALLIPAIIHDYGYLSDEFSSPYASGGKWTNAVTSGGGPTPFATGALRGGSIQGSTGATDNDAIAIYHTGVIFDPDDNPFFFIQWKANVITDFSFEIGLSDAKADEALPGITDVDTPTVGNGVTDIACVHMDTDQTLKTADLVAGAAAGAGTASTGPSLATAAYTPTGGAWQTFGIGVRDNLAYASIWDGDGFVGRFSVGNGPDGGTLVRPYALFRTRSTTPKTIDIRKMALAWEQND